MRCVVQRVREARVEVDGQVVGQIGQGLLVLVAFAATDTEAELEWMARKLPQLRIFPDETGKMNRSVEDVRGGILVVSQFTLYGSLKKGTRPSFSRSAPPEQARQLYQQFVEMLRAATSCSVETGIFQAYMQVYLVNDGPVTIILEREAPSV